MDGIIFHRLANILHLTNVSENKFWEIARKVKSDLSLLDNSCSRRSGIYTSNQVILALAVGYQFEDQLSEEIFDNMKAEYLKTAAEIFIYLYTCPVSDIDNKLMIFYDNLFKTQTPYQIILTLNRMMKMKSPQIRNDIWIQKLFKKAASMFSLKYEEVKSILPMNQTLIKDHSDNLNFLEAKGIVFIVHFLSAIFSFLRYSKHQSPSAYCHQQQPNLSISLDTILRFWRKHVSNGSQD